MVSLPLSTAPWQDRSPLELHAGRETASHLDLNRNNCNAVLYEYFYSNVQYDTVSKT